MVVFYHRPAHHRLAHLTSVQSYPRQVCKAILHHRTLILSRQENFRFAVKKVIFAHEDRLMFLGTFPDPFIFSRNHPEIFQSIKEAPGVWVYSLYLLFCVKDKRGLIEEYAGLFFVKEGLNLLVDFGPLTHA